MGLFKKSKKEQAEEYAAQASDRAGDFASKIADNAKEAATAALAWAGAAGEKLGPVAQDAAHRVSDAAKDAADKAKPYVDDAKHRAQPYFDDAKHRAQPYIDNASARTDETVTKVREDYLPRAKRAAEAAAEEARNNKGRKGKRDLATRTQDVINVSKKELSKPEKKSGAGKKLFGFTVVLAAVGAAAYALFQRSKPAEDPWAESYWDDLTNADAGTEDSTPAEKIFVDGEETDASNRPVDETSVTGEDIAQEQEQRENAETVEVGAEDLADAPHDATDDENRI